MRAFSGVSLIILGLVACFTGCSSSAEPPEAAKENPESHPTLMLERFASADSEASGVDEWDLVVDSGYRDPQEGVTGYATARGYRRGVSGDARTEVVRVVLRQGIVDLFTPGNTLSMTGPRARAIGDDLKRMQAASSRVSSGTSPSGASPSHVRIATASSAGTCEGYSGGGWNSGGGTPSGGTLLESPCTPLLASATCGESGNWFTQLLSGWWTSLVEFFENPTPSCMSGHFQDRESGPVTCVDDASSKTSAAASSGTQGSSTTPTETCTGSTLEAKCEANQSALIQDMAKVTSSARGYTAAEVCKLTDAKARSQEAEKINAAATSANNLVTSISGRLESHIKECKDKSKYYTEHRSELQTASDAFLQRAKADLTELNAAITCLEK